MQLTLSKREPAAALLPYLAEARWKKEVDGIRPSSFAIRTDRESQAMIARAVQYLRDSPAGTVISYKTPAGSVDVTLEQLQPLAMLAGAHVQACFAKEAEVAAAINAEPPTVFTREQIDDAFAEIASAGLFAA